MSDQKQTAPDDDSTKKTNPPDSTPKAANNTSGNEPRTKTDGSERQQINYKSVYVVTKDKDPQAIANRISVANLILSVIVAGFTGYLLLMTIEANKTSSEALKEAKRANDHIIHKDSIDHINDSISSIYQNLKDSQSIAISNKSLAAQISSIKETQREFEALHQPYLQVEDVNLSPIGVNEKLDLDIGIENVSEVPAKVISQKSSWAVSTYILPIDSLRRHLKSQDKKAGNYITHAKPTHFKFTLTNGLQLDEFKWITERNGYILFCREIKYKNVVTGKLRVYLFYLSMRPVKNNKLFPNGTFYQIEYNENYGILD